MLSDKAPESVPAELATLRQKLKKAEGAAKERTQSTEKMLRQLLVEVSELERQAAIVQEMIEASSEAVIIVDPNWSILYRNSNAIRIAAGGDIQGRNLWQALPMLEDTIFAERCRQCMTERKRIIFEEFFEPWQDWFAFSFTPLGAGIGIFFRDTAEQHRRDAVLQQVEKLAVVGRLASSISHEINNPLESVVNLLYIIQHADSASDEVKAYALQAMGELSRVSHIVTQSLKFHRQSTSAENIRISELLESVLSLFQGRIVGLPISIHRAYADHDFMVCFAGDMRQVFANLIGNALDALKIGSRLTLRTQVTQNWRTGEQGLRVTVADNGSGMSEETRLNMFEPFFTTKPATGTGLGLWVSEDIIHNHKGTMKVRSCEREGRSGTIFSMFFPATIIATAPLS